MTLRSTARWIGAAALLAGLLLASPTPTDPFQRCHWAVRDQPQAQAGYLCFFEVARDADRRDDALRQLRELELASPWATFTLAHMAFAASSLKEAETSYQEAAARFEAAGELRGSVLARTNLWRIYSNLGDQPSAADQVERVRATTRASTEPELRIRAHLLEASDLLYGDSGDLQKVADLLRDVEAWLPPSGLDGPRELFLELRVDLYYTEGRLERTLRATEELFALRTARGPSLALARDALFTAAASAELAPGADARPQAIARAEQAVAIAQTVNEEISEARSSALLGALLGPDQPERARSLFDRCFALSAKLELPRLRVECLFWKADRSPGLPADEADRSSAEAVELASTIDDQLHVDAWTRRLRVLWRTRSTAEAWRETQRGLAVLEKLADYQSRDVNSAYMLLDTQELYRWIVGRLLATTPPMVSEAFELMERVRARSLFTSVSGPSAARDAQAVGLPAVQAVLRPNQALVLLQVARATDVFGEAAGGSWALAVMRDRVQVASIPERRVLGAKVPLLVGLIERRDGSEAKAVAAFTSELLSETLAALPPGVDELLISADGVLHSLPFPALREGPDRPPLGARFAIVSIPSARLWAHWVRQARLERRARLLVLADPSVAPVTSPSWAALASQRDGELGPLPGARDEGQWLAEQFRGSADLHIGAEAREHLLKSTDLARYGLLHFAAHAVADESEPDASAVVLAPGEGDDGFLRPTEIEALRLDHAVVVLSACQGASGQAVGGEGVFSLSRAFLKAGADAVIASLWPLRDDDALWFFRAFYRNLAGGTSLGAALKATRRQAIDAGLPTRAWAGIVLIGDGSLVPQLPARAAAPGSSR